MIKRMMGGKGEAGEKSEDPLVAAKNIIATLIVLAGLLWMADLLLGVDTSTSTNSLDMNAYADHQYQCTDNNGDTSIVTNANNCNGVTQLITHGSGNDAGASGGIVGGIKEVETMAGQVVGSILFILKIVVTVAAIAVIGVLRVRPY